MVFSQSYSQAPSHLVLPKEDHGLAPYSMDRHSTAPKIIEPHQLGNAAINGDVRSFKGSTFCVTSGNGNAVSPLKSSWVQRLIPSHDTQLEQLQVSDNLRIENHCMDDGALKESAAQYEIPLYENSRRSKQDFDSGNQRFMGTNSLCYDGAVVNTATGSVDKALEALQPDVRVSPNPLPVVDSLLSGCSKKVTENEALTEMNKLSFLSKCTGFFNQIKQTVYFCADDRSRVSCSSIEGLKSWTAGHLPPVKPLELGKTRFNSSQLDPEFPLNSADFSTRFKLDASGKNRQTSTNLSRGCVNLSQTRPTANSFATVPLFPMNHSSSLERHETVENSLLHRTAVPYKAEAVESFPKSIIAQANASIDHIRHLKTSDRDHWHAMECHKCEDDSCIRSEAFTASGSASEGEGCLGHNLGKDGPPGVSNMVPFHHGIDRVNEAAGGFLSYCMNEQELGSSHGSHEKQAGTSSSFSFHVGNRLLYNSEQVEAVIGKGVFSFCPNTVSSEDFVQQSRCLREVKNGDFAETTRPGMFLHDSSTLQKIDGGEAETVCMPIEDDISPYKASCNDGRGVLLGSVGTEAVRCNGTGEINQAKAKALGGGHFFFGTKFCSRNEETEETGVRYLPPLEKAVNVNWMGCTSSIGGGRALPCASAYLNQVDGTSTIFHSTDDVGSCLKRPRFISDVDQARRTVSSAIGKQFHSANKQVASTGQSVALESGTSERCEDVAQKGPVVKQRMWLQRWDTTQTRKAQGVSKMNRERSISTGMSHNRYLRKTDCSRSHCSRGFSHSYYEDFDFRPTKRVCHEKRSGLLFEAGKAVSKRESEAPSIENNKDGGVSNFMKRFFTPSAAAMAVMGMTARQVHAIEPQKKSLFGVWASNASITKPPSAQAELCKNVMKEPKSKNEFSQYAPKPSSAPMDA